MRRCCGVPSGQSKLTLERSAKLFSEAGMHIEAARALVERAKLSPRNPMIWNDLGVQYVAAGQLEEAQGAFRRAYTAFPEYPLPLYNLGGLAIARCVEEQARQYPSLELTRKLAMEAIQYLAESLSRDPLLWPAHALLSSAYAVIGDHARSRFHGQEASRLSPENGAEGGRIRGENFLLRKLRKQPGKPALPFILSSGETINVGTR